MEGYFNYNTYLINHSLHVESAYTYGKLYDLPYKGYPALVEGDDIVYGQIITVKHLNILLASLDTLENYSNSCQDEYQRQQRVVFDQFGNALFVYCFIYQIHNDNKFFQNAIYLKEGNWDAYMKQKKE